MKHAVSTLVLVVAVACTCLAMATPITTKANEGIMPFCRVNCGK